MWDQVTSVWEGMQSSLGWTEVLIALAFSLLFSLVIYFMYLLFYGSRHIGAGVHRMFLMGGPAITVLFLAIQTSIPLSLGLLGALSFVRFRTPVKDPAEIGFLLLLIASSIGAATGNFMIIGVLLVAAFLVLGVKWLLRDRVAVGNRGSLMLSLDQADFGAVETRLRVFSARSWRALGLNPCPWSTGRSTCSTSTASGATLDWPELTKD